RSITRHLHGSLKHLTVASAIRLAAFYRNFHFVPLLRLVLLQLRIRPGNQIIATLQLRLAKKDAPVRKWRPAKFQLEHEILWKFSRCPQSFDLAIFRWSRDDQPPVQRHVTAIAADGFSVEIIGLESPAGQVAAVEEAYEARFHCKIVRLG